MFCAPQASGISCVFGFTHSSLHLPNENNRNNREKEKERERERERERKSETRKRESVRRERGSIIVFIDKKFQSSQRKK